jgi:hypothetical protein
MLIDMALLEGRRRWAEHDNWLLRHSLGVVLITLLVLQTAHALWAGHRVWQTEALVDATILGKPMPDVQTWLSWDFWLWWGWEYQVSLVADTFGAVLLVMLSKWLYEEGSAESEQGG